MLKAFLKVFGAGLSVGPGFIGICMGLSSAAKESGFDKISPANYANLLSLISLLLYVVIEHLIGYIALCAIVAIIWTLWVAEPRAKSKRKFDQRRRNRIGDKR